MNRRALIVDDDPGLCELLGEALPRRGLATTCLSSAAEVFPLLEAEDFDVILTDLHMGGMSGLELCRRIVAYRPDVPVVVLTGFGSLETAVAALRAGAYDFITKPFDVDVLALALERAIEHGALRDEVRRLRQMVDDASPRGPLLGASPPMQRLHDLIARVAVTDASVLLTGESGTGKELVARALHDGGRRGAGPFVAVSCAAMPETLLESELFGHARGAFTDARAARTGLFVQASGGTLFLDEIGEMPLGLQPKLLRALQERVARPLGGDEEMPFDVRLITATNRDLEAAVEQGRFREDLYFRIHVIPIAVPALRVRGHDVLLLAQHFVHEFAERAGKRVSGFTPGVAAMLGAYAWPGNVRELRNAIERAVALTHYDRLTVEDLPERVREAPGSPWAIAPDDPVALSSLEEVERRHIRLVLKAAGGNKTRAARTLGLDRKTLYRKLRDATSPAAPGAPAH